jgi:hypothetical protein
MGDYDSCPTHALGSRFSSAAAIKSGNTSGVHANASVLWLSKPGAPLSFSASSRTPLSFHLGGHQQYFRAGLGSRPHAMPAYQWNLRLSHRLHSYATSPTGCNLRQWHLRADTDFKNLVSFSRSVSLLVGRDSFYVPYYRRIA